MGGPRVKVIKSWKVEYKKSFFRQSCTSCGWKTRELVQHVITDYFHEDGSPHFIPLSSSWHYLCHDKNCQHVFCVEQRRYRRIDTFGVYITEVIKALEDMIKIEDVPEFLSSPHPQLSGLSPTHIIWAHGEWGFKRVMQIIEGIASGAFV